jgi:hypothetical protein
MREEPHPKLKMGHFRLGCDSPPVSFLQTRSCKWCPSIRNRGEDASLQKLLDLQRWPRHRLGGGSDTRTDDSGQRGRAAHAAGLFRLLYRLGVDDDCPIRLSAAKALGVEPSLGVISSIDPPRGPRAWRLGSTLHRDGSHRQYLCLCRCPVVWSTNLRELLRLLAQANQ